MSKIFKINLLKNNRVTDVFIFNGEKGSEIPKSISKSKNDSNDINDANQSVHNINGFIHEDDSIMRIKEKIAKYCLKDSITSELYLYAITKKQIIHNIVYSELTQSNTMELTKDVFNQYIKNIVGVELPKDSMKKTNESDETSDETEYYSYIDFINLINKIVKDGDYVNKLTNLGQKIVINKRYPFCVNPYNNEYMDDKINQSTNIVSTENRKLLFNYGEIKDDNIFVCLTEDVLTNKNDNVTEKYLMKLYYPSLFSKSIVDLSLLKENKNELLDDEDERLGDDFENYNKASYCIQ